MMFRDRWFPSRNPLELLGLPEPSQDRARCDDGLVLRGATKDTHPNQMESVMSDIIRLRVERDLAAVPADALSLRFGPRLLTEARDSARYFQLHYAPREDADDPRPGLADVGLDPETGAVITFLVAEIERLNESIYAEGPLAGFPVAKVRELLGEVRGALVWVAAGDPSLANWVGSLRRVHRRVSTADLVSALSEYARAGRAAEARLRTLRAFDPAVLDEAEALEREWVGRPEIDRTLRERRQKLAWLLRDHMRRVVAAADYAFRRHPELRRAARSERMLRERAAAARTRRERRDAAAATTPATQPTP
jgi:hypothetical protein